MRFEFYIGGYPGPSYSLELKGKYLYVDICHSYDTGDHSYILIDISDHLIWNQLIAFLRTRKWKLKYELMAIDGTLWSIKFEEGDKKLISQGENKYPPGFKKVLSILSEIAEVDIS
jgi:hypothetical protein